jgi:hypothetical protein
MTDERCFFARARELMTFCLPEKVRVVMAPDRRRPMAGLIAAAIHRMRSFDGSVPNLLR